MRKIACFVLLVTILSGCEKAYVQSEVIPDKVSFQQILYQYFQPVAQAVIQMVANSHF